MLASTALVLVLTGSALSSSGNYCSGIGTWTATCDVRNSGDSLDLTGQLTRPPNAGRDNMLDAKPAPPRDCGALNRCDDFTVSLLPQATIADVASFAPQPSTLAAQCRGNTVRPSGDRAVHSGRHRDRAGRRSDSHRRRHRPPTRESHVSLTGRLRRDGHRALPGGGRFRSWLASRSRNPRRSHRRLCDRGAGGPRDTRRSRVYRAAVRTRMLTAGC
ncbi:MAG: hypothetical protein K0S49_1180 [Microbacterium sp.]|nr:hypothetical protein [Microbacterium sp.]